ncbi:unnamed protein product [Camellia sinensis]
MTMETKIVIRRKKRVNYFDFLPDDILFNILVLIPTELLRLKLKYVCKRWFNLISNRILFDLASLIIQRPIRENRHIYETRRVDVNEGKLKLWTTVQDLNIPCRGRIRSWCNELLLITDPHNLGALYIFNVNTQDGSTLPPCSSSCKGHFGCKCGIGLAFDKIKGSYKVVHVYVGLHWIECEILVLECKLSSFNCSKWEKISGPSYIGQRRYYWDDPISVEGRFLHWDVHSAEFIVSMDVAEERFFQTRLPEYSNSFKSNEYFLTEIGGRLSLLLPVSGSQVDIWILKTTWEKLQSIRYICYVSSSIHSGIVLPDPIGSLRNGSNIIFRKTGSDSALYAYSFQFKHMKQLEIGIQANERCLVQSTAKDFL